MLDIQKDTIKQLNVSCMSVERIRYLRGFVIGIQSACATDKVWLFSLFSRGVEYVVCTSGFFLDIRSKTQGEKTKTQAQKTQNSRNFYPKLEIPANF